MILQDCNINYGDSLDKTLRSLLGDDYLVSQFHSTVHERDYNVFMCESTETALVLKKTEDINEVNSYRLLKAIDDKNTPIIHQIVKDQEEHWLVMEYLASHKDIWEKDDIQDLVKILAKIHTSFSEENTNITALREWKHAHTSKEDLFDLVDSDLTREHVNVVLKSQKILRDTYKTFIHGDMIPLNMIVSKEGVKIIDWEHGHMGPYILDVGRLLADYNIDKPWINPQWEKDILKSYYHALIGGGLAISYDKMFLDYQCARLDNYLGIVSAFKKRKWDKTKWYDLNLKQMILTIHRIDRLLNKRT